MRNKFIPGSLFTILTVLFFSGSVSAQNSVTLPTGGLRYFLYGVLAFIILAIFFTVYYVKQRNKYRQEALLRTGKTKERSALRQWWSNLDKRFFTKAAPLEKEADVLLDHDYDGIKELDNALPPWWKWGFYFTIGVAIIYLLRFHVFKTGPTPEDEYNKEMQIASARMELYRSKNKELFDEKTVTLADAAGVADGKKIFTSTCFPCHGMKGEGGVGPNLTDQYWLHGGTINDIFKTIKYGVPDKGMQAWGKTYSATDIRNLASFILSLQGSNPPNAKAPQGNFFQPGQPADSSAMKKDSVKAAPVK